MPSLQIRKLPMSIYSALKKAASEQNHSLSQQAIIALTKGLEVPEDFRERRKRVIAKIQAEQDQWLEITPLDAVDWIRADRDR